MKWAALEHTALYNSRGFQVKPKHPIVWGNPEVDICAYHLRFLDKLLHIHEPNFPLL